jgi:hypothetical protein
MRKLKLELDRLEVESFDTASTQKRKGTVIGEELCTCNTYCGQATCPGCPTCDNTCAYTCDDATCPACPTCANTCANTCDDPSCYDTCGLSCWDTCRPRLCGPYYPEPY